jgi:hypothetical protein
VPWASRHSNPTATPARPSRGRNFKATSFKSSALIELH